MTNFNLTPDNEGPRDSADCDSESTFSNSAYRSAALVATHLSNLAGFQSINDEETYIDFDAIEALSLQEPVTCIPVVVAALSDASPVVRAGACHILAGLRYRDFRLAPYLEIAAARILNRMEESDEQVRTQAVHVAGYLDVSDLFPAVPRRESSRFVSHELRFACSTLASCDPELAFRICSAMNLVRNSPSLAIFPIIERLGKLEYYETPRDYPGLEEVDHGEADDYIAATTALVELDGPPFYSYEEEVGDMSDALSVRIAQMFFERWALTELILVIAESQREFVIEELKPYRDSDNETLKATATWVLDQLEKNIRSQVQATQSAARPSIDEVGTIPELIEAFDNLPQIENEYFEATDAQVYGPAQVILTLSESDISQENPLWRREYELNCKKILQIALGELPQSIESLAIASEGKNISMVLGAVRVLGDLANHSADAREIIAQDWRRFCPLLTHYQDGIRGFTMRLLGSLRKTCVECLPQLLQMAHQDPSLFVRTKTHEALGLIAPDNSDVHKILLLAGEQWRATCQGDLSSVSIDDHYSHPVGVYCGLAACIQYIPRATELLTDACSYTDDAFHQSVAKGLAHVPDFKLAEPLLTRLLFNHFQITRQIALSTLGSFGEPARYLIEGVANHDLDCIISDWAKHVLARTNLRKKPIL